MLRWSVAPVTVPEIEPGPGSVAAVVVGVAAIVSTDDGVGREGRV